MLLVALAWIGEVEAGQLHLVWIDNSTSEDGFAIERMTGTAGPWAPIAATGADVTAYTDLAVDEHTSYCYRVQAFNAGGRSAYSDLACGVARASPALPTLTLEMFRSDQSMILTMTLSPGISPLLVDGYVLLRLPDGRFFSLLANRTLVPGIVPIAAGFIPFPVTGEILRYAFNWNEPPGSYLWFGALTQSGTLIPIGTVEQIPFTLGP